MQILVIQKYQESEMRKLSMDFQVFVRRRCCYPHQTTFCRECGAASECRYLYTGKALVGNVIEEKKEKYLNFQAFIMYVFLAIRIAIAKDLLVTLAKKATISNTSFEAMIASSVFVCDSSMVSEQTQEIYFVK